MCRWPLIAWLPWPIYLDLNSQPEMSILPVCHVVPIPSVDEITNREPRIPPPKMCLVQCPPPTPGSEVAFGTAWLEQARVLPLTFTDNPNVNSNNPFRLLLTTRAQQQTNVD